MFVDGQNENSDESQILNIVRINIKLILNAKIKLFLKEKHEVSSLFCKNMFFFLIY